MSRKFIKIITSFVLVLLAIFAGLIAFISTTEPGLRLIASQISNNSFDYFGGNLTVKDVHGRLIDNFQIEGFNYQSTSLDLKIDKLELEWEHLALLKQVFHVDNFSASGIYISRKTYSATNKKTNTRLDKNKKGTGTLPVKIVLDQFLLDNITIVTDKKAPTIIKQITSDTISIHHDFNVDNLTVKTKNIQASMTGHADFARTLPVNFTIKWLVDIPGRPPIQGNGIINGDLQRLEITQSITNPQHTRLTGIITSSATEITALNDYSFTLDATIQGNKNIPQSSWELTGKGDLNGASFEKLQGKLLDGEINGTGKLSWQPEIAWNIQFNGQKLNPGILWSEWTGNIRFSGHTSSELKNKKLISHIVLDALGGDLRSYPLSGKAQVDLEPESINIKTFYVGTGTNILSLSGKIARTWGIEWKLDAPDLQALSPYIKGNLTAQGKISGNKTTPVISLSMSGNNIEYKAAHITDMELLANIAVNSSDISSFDVAMENIDLAGRWIDSFEIEGKGTNKLHHLNASLLSNNLTASIGIQGSLLKKQWDATLQSTQFKSNEYGEWKLTAPSPLHASMNELDLEKTCWENKDAALCAHAHWDKQTGWNASTSGRRLSFAIINPLLQEQITLSGTFDADINMAIPSKSGLLTGNAAIETGKGKISQNLSSGSIIDFDFDRLKLVTNLDNQQLSGNLSLILPDEDYINSTISLPRTIINASHSWKEKSDIPVEGQLSAQLDNLGLIPYFVSGIEETKGVVNADLSITGTLKNPQVGGKMSLTNGSLEIPRAGIQINDIGLLMTGDKYNIFNISSQMHSGKGSVSITGTIGLDENNRLTTNLNINGKDFETVRIPEIELFTSPELNIHIKEKIINLTGRMNIPEAYLEPRNLETTIRPSADVRIKQVDMPDIKEQKWTTHSLVRLTSGEKVVFTGFGLTGNITGDVVIMDTSKEVTTALGELQIKGGEYRAYGQKLKIDTGRLLFVGGPIDNPGLDIRAIRKTGNVIAGVDIQGTLQSPRTSVFSDPVMEESDALSYLILGRPMNQASREEGQLLHGAATSIGFAGGEYLAKEIGQEFNIDEVSIESESTYEETSLFLGKQISSKLYIRYGIGLIEAVNIFQLQYKLGSQWSLHAETGFQQGADLLYTIERK